MSDPVAKLIETYHELNAAVVDELYEEPSPLEFLRYVSKNRPFVVRGAAGDWEAVKRWNAENLRRVMDGESVKVAVTPFGNADAVVEREDGTLCFVEPHETFELFSDFLDALQEDSRTTASSKNVQYAQTQNDNLREEYNNLFVDVPKDIPFARIALEKEADAINMWIGNERSVTAMHKDNYENIYVQIRGQKHFVLLAPVEMPCVNEQLLSQARYAPSDRDSSADLVIEPGEDDELLPVAVWDPDNVDEGATPYSHLAKPLRVTLNQGDLLYLPAMWYHKVSQTAGEEGFACAVNYWYDMEFSGSFWACQTFVREIVDSDRQRLCDGGK